MATPKVSKPKATRKPPAKAKPESDAPDRASKSRTSFAKIHDHIDLSAKKIHQRINEAHKSVEGVSGKIEHYVVQFGNRANKLEQNVDSTLNHLVALKYTTVIVGVISALALAGVLYIIF